MNKIACVIVAIVATLMLLPDISAAESPNISYFDIKIVDDEGHDAENVLAHSYTIDTITDVTGTTYILRAHVSLQAAPCNILIESDEGEFNVYSSVTGLSSYLEEAGMRIEMTDGDKTYTSDLTSANRFDKVYFKSDSGRAILKPNVLYPINIMTLDDVEHTIAPETVKDVVLSFTAHLKEGFHQVAFYSDDTLVEEYKLYDGEKIRPLPIVTKEGYELDGWFTPDGEQILEGRTVTENDGDIVANAKWTPISSPSGTDFNWIIPVIITAAILGLLMIFLVYRRRRSASA